VTRYLLVREFDSSSKAFPAIVEAVLREDSSASFVLEGRREGYVQDSVMTIYSIALAE